jgi:hypothetical protein
MKLKMISLIVILSFLFSALIVPASNLSNSNLKTSSNNNAELPEWAISNFWKYDMDFRFKVKEGSTIKFSINANIYDLYATVTEKTNIDGTDMYVLSLTGHLQGDITLFQTKIDIADVSGPLTGTAEITKDELAIKKFVFEVDGIIDTIIGDLDLHFEMIMTFNPYFDFFDFPINAKEDPWDVIIDEAYLHAYAEIELFGTHQYESSMAFSDVLCVDRTEVITTGAGIFDTFVLSGTWGDPSQLWYAPAAGYLVKVNEVLNWDDGYIVSDFNLNLLDTNYDVANKPPIPPDKPFGETDGEIDTEYTYTTKTTDPNNDNIWYRFDWGDGTDSDWIGPYSSGQQVSASHSWYSKGMYNVIAQAKDEYGIVSDCSEPLSVNIKGDPKVIVTMNKIEKLDEIDYDPIGDDEPPEYYYILAVEGEGTNSLPVTYCNTDDGTYKDDESKWNSEDVWQLNDLKHEFTVSSNNPVISIQLMDFDAFWGGDDDLADVSGCNVPDGNGIDDLQEGENTRKAVYHGTYNLIDKKLKDYQTGAPEENADYIYKDGAYFVTKGDNKPDSTTGYENGIKDPENDAAIWFRIDTDYKNPIVSAKVIETGKLRPKEEIHFTGNVNEGAPPYMWSWDFGDETIIKDAQNPSHIYNSDGQYTVEVTVTDSFGQISTYEFDIDVINYNPILTKDDVEWTGGGSTKDTFSFTVHYIDPDSDLPSVKKLFVDARSWDLIGEGSNSDYDVDLLGSELGSGEHTYYFYFEDGHGGWAKSLEKTLTVEKSRDRNYMLIDFIFKLFDYYPIFLKFFNLF